MIYSCLVSLKNKMRTFKQFIFEHLSQEELAKKLEVDLSVVKKLSQTELDIILKYVGRHDFKPDAEFDAKELAKGIKVEHEHTDNDIIAKLIAKDHLMELPDYYSKLEKMENE